MSGWAAAAWASDRVATAPGQSLLLCLSARRCSVTCPPARRLSRLCFGFGCTNSTGLSPGALTLASAASRRRRRRRIGQDCSPREELEEKGVCSRRSPVISLMSQSSSLLFLLQFKKNKCIDYGINDTIFARFEVIIIVHTRFSSLVLKKRHEMGVYCVEKQTKSHEYCEACHFVL